VKVSDDSAHKKLLKQIGVDVAFVVPIFPIISENNVQKEGAVFGLGSKGFGGGMFDRGFFHDIPF
jgi:hypothetical protein